MRCIFCGSTDLSDEHIWPVWAHDLIRRTRPKNRRHIWRATIRGKAKSIEKPGDITTIKLKVVCKRHCNNGWMSRLETRVKPVLVPLLTGSSIQLNRYNQEILATWIAMKLQICEFSSKDNAIVTPALERSLLMGRRIPPDIMAIWIAKYHGERENSYFREAAGLAWINRQNGEMIPPIAPADRLSIKTTQSQTLIIGELFVQAITTTVPRIVFQMPPSAGATFRQIWPFQRDFSWPPASVIGDNEANAIATALGRQTKTLRSAPTPL